MCFYDLEPATFLKDTWPKARKEHLCSDCGETIRKGEKYNCLVTVFDGDLVPYNICKSCIILSDRITGTEILRGCGRYEASPPIAGATEHLIECGEMPWETPRQKHWAKVREERRRERELKRSKAS